ncbi:hypothetical protein KSP40_PGU014824 [Platanthera guangdongensis]|uniref:Uncharacterized protein n=1 Tax=Platanthera guangdongensis TaxID=2320717 RepID=A0ABR2N0X0_9ASPA
MGSVEPYETLMLSTDMNWLTGVPAPGTFTYGYPSSAPIDLGAPPDGSKSPIGKMHVLFAKCSRMDMNEMARRLPMQKSNFCCFPDKSASHAPGEEEEELALEEELILACFDIFRDEQTAWVIPLHLPPGDTSTERNVHIDGTTEQIESAKQLVNEVISERVVSFDGGIGLQISVDFKYLRANFIQSMALPPEVLHNRFDWLNVVLDNLLSISHDLHGRLCVAPPVPSPTSSLSTSLAWTLPPAGLSTRAPLSVLSPLSLVLDLLSPPSSSRKPDMFKISQWCSCHHFCYCRLHSCTFVHLGVPSPLD